MVRKGKVKEEKTHEVRWRLAKLSQCPVKKQVHGDLMLPSVKPIRYSGEWVHLPVRLVLLSNNDDTKHALTIMRDSTGSNILHARLVTEGPSGIHAWVEPFRGNLEYYLRSSRLGISGHRDTKFVLPSPCLRSAVGGVFDGMKQLIVAGLYHGNFSLANTYYSMDEEDWNTLEVKLCNFKKKQEGTYKKKLCGDWRAILAGLRLIREIADTLKEIYPSIDCCQLDDLINFMERITPRIAEEACEEIRRQPFFWGKEEWKSFFIHDIPVALRENQFVIKVKNAKVIDLPWNNKEFPMALACMNRYRASKGKEEYDTNCPVAFVKCVSGLYTHESDLKLWKKVHEIIQDHCPDLYYKLYVLLPGAKT